MDKKSTVYVLGSGSSLLNLSNEEKKFLQNQTTVAMNKYIIFWQKIGIFPDYLFLADIHYPAIKIFQESYDIILRSNNNIHFLLDSSYKTLYLHGSFNTLEKIKKIKYNFIKIISFLKKNRFLYKPWINIDKVTYFKRFHCFDAPLKWANSLDEELFFYRGSLSCLINLLTIMPLGNTIKLLGVDLNTANSFYHEEIQKRPDLLDSWTKTQSENVLGFHATALPLENGQPGIQALWSFLQENVINSGKNIFCCNPNSLLVQEGLCKYAPIIE